MAMISNLGLMRIGEKTHRQLQDREYLILATRRMGPKDPFFAYTHFNEQRAELQIYDQYRYPSHNARRVDIKADDVTIRTYYGTTEPDGWANPKYTGMLYTPIIIGTDWINPKDDEGGTYTRGHRQTEVAIIHKVGYTKWLRVFQYDNVWHSGEEPGASTTQTDTIQLIKLGV